MAFDRDPKQFPDSSDSSKGGVDDDPTANIHKYAYSAQHGKFFDILGSLKALVSFGLCADLVRLD